MSPQKHWPLNWRPQRSYPSEAQAASHSEGETLRDFGPKISIGRARSEFLSL